MASDWMKDAAAEIAADSDDGSMVLWMRSVIERHCPPAPRCSTCKYWTRDDDKRSNEGQCGRMYEEDAKMWPDGYDGINTTADFGCVEWEEK